MPRHDATTELLVARAEATLAECLPELSESDRDPTFNRFMSNMALESVQVRNEFDPDIADCPETGAPHVLAEMDGATFCVHCDFSSTG